MEPTSLWNHQLAVDDATTPLTAQEKRRYARSYRRVPLNASYTW
jgi:hypothetical protein